MTEHPGDKPKIIVDADWKSQVEAEKEEIRRREETVQNQQQQSSAPSKDAGQDAGATGAAAAYDRAAEKQRGQKETMPPASFSLLVSSLATQAMAALGQIPDPLENKTVVRLPVARHYIDTLGVLEEKTQENLTAEEKSLLTHVLADLRMTYVAVESQVGKQGTSP